MLTITTIAPSGLRLVHYRSPERVEYFGMAIAVGSRDEAPGDEGLAHFVEHTIFKGTSRRRAWHILNRMEAIGGELNAYTTKEETMVYTVAPAGHLRRGAELVMDLLTSATFPDSELRKERQVVIDEINSYLDSPAERIFDDFDECIFADTPLEHNILGSTESVNRFTSADCLRWTRTHYTADKMVAFYLGPLDADKVVRLLSSLPQPPATGTYQRPKVEVSTAPFVRTLPASEHQNHTVVGCLLPDIFSAPRHALGLLTNVLGGPGMNSLLNLELRERRGLVYSVDAASTLYSDCGLLTIYFGCDPDDTRRCTDLVLGVLRRLSEQGLTPSRLAAAKRQYSGQLTVSAQSRENVILACARALIYGLTPTTSEQSAALIDAITEASLTEVYPLLSPTRFSTLTLATH